MVIVFFLALQFDDRLKWSLVLGLPPVLSLLGGKGSGSPTYVAFKFFGASLSLNANIVINVFAVKSVLYFNVEFASVV